MSTAMTAPREILGQLIRIPSVNPMGRAVSGPQYGEARVTEFLCSFFDRLGVPYIRQEVAPQRHNVIACFEPDDAVRTILFDAHQDTVPVEGMTIAPFEPTLRNGRMYGRGACDVKGGMAAMLAAFVRLVQERPPRSARLLVSCTCDEEFTATGIQHLMDHWDQVTRQLCGTAVRVDEAIVAEPTDLHIVVAHRGVVRWRVTTFGRACHSSEPERGENAIYRMAYLLQALEAYSLQLSSHAARDPLCGPPSLSVGRVEGGVSVNMVPDRCVAEVDRRLVPGEDPAQVIAAIDNYVSQYLRDHTFPRTMPPQGWQFEQPWIISPPLSPQTNRQLADRLASVAELVLGWRPPLVGVRYGTHASRTSAAGIPSVVFGPGAIAQAHTADEWIDLEQVDQASEILYRYCLE